MASRNYEKNKRKKREKAKAAARALAEAKDRAGFRPPAPFRQSFSTGADLASAAALMANDALLRRLFG